MAAVKTTTITALAGKLIVDTALSTSTAQTNVTAATSGTMYSIDIDNTANASTFAYVRIRDHATATPNDNTAGVPTWQFVAPPATKISYTFPDGQEYSAGVTIWCSTNPANANVTAPASSVIVRLVAS
tara:strand:- start:189 stop:572 length:384 start_codon:yes stop_codon:yes gene_type:complete